MVFVKKSEALTKDGEPKKGITVVTMKSGQKRYLDKSKKGVRKIDNKKETKCSKKEKCEEPEK